MPNAVIVSRARTPIARAMKGSLVDVDAFALANVAVGAAVERSGIPVEELDDVVLAESLQGGGVIARYVAVDLGMARVPGMANNRHCAGGLGAVQIAAASIMAGMDRVVAAGGTESLSTMPQTTKMLPPDYQAVEWRSASHPETPAAPAWDMSITVGENTARLAGISRAEVDAWALRSHHNAAASVANGWFDEVVPVPTARGAFTTDEHPRADTSLEKLASLPVLHPEIEGATVTAGNAAGLNDAAAALVLVAEDYAAANGLQPLARIRSWASVGVEPERTGLAPTEAIPKALERGGLGLGDIGLFEVNEAFCSVGVAATKVLGLDPAIVNVNGSGCGLGHPIAATGARMVSTMIGELERRDASLGVVSMCAGGGMGSALVIERI
jgi:acetyl-CoA acetyltransferase family protein